MIRCPRCGKQTAFTPANPSRPFCSERCKMIDLGGWADETYRVPVKSHNDATDDSLSDSEEISDSESEPPVKNGRDEQI